MIDEPEYTNVYIGNLLVLVPICMLYNSGVNVNTCGTNCRFEKPFVNVNDRLLKLYEPVRLMVSTIGLHCMRPDDNVVGSHEYPREVGIEPAPIATVPSVPLPDADVFAPVNVPPDEVAPDITVLYKVTLLIDISDIKISDETFPMGVFPAIFIVIIRAEPLKTLTPFTDDDIVGYNVDD